MSGPDKKTVREHFRLRRSQIDPKNRTPYAEAFARRANTWLHAKAKEVRTVAGYFPLKEELDVLPFLKDCLEQGMSVAFPAVVDENLVFRKVEKIDAKDFKKHGRLGVMEPPENCPEVTPQMLLVPMVAFDAGGARMGFGGGYYDRTIAKFRAEKYNIVIAGAAYECQKAEVLPLEETDQHMDVVITEVATYEAKKG